MTGVWCMVGAWAQADRPVVDLAEIEALVVEVVDASFPELANAIIEVRPTSGQSVLFVSRPDIGSWIHPGRPTRYVLGVSHHALAGDLPRAAAEGIVAHELAHTLSYVRDGATGIWAAAWTQVWGPARIDAERHTDLVALARGYGPGLVAYRSWIYPRLGPRHLRKKRETYLTPEEIVQITAADPALRAMWLRQPPRSIDDVEAAITRRRDPPR